MVGREFVGGRICQNPIFLGLIRQYVSLVVTWLTTRLIPSPFLHPFPREIRKRYLLGRHQKVLCDCPNILRAKHILLAIEPPEENKREDRQALLRPFKFSPHPLNQLKRSNDLLYTFVYSKTTLLEEGKLVKYTLLLHMVCLQIVSFNFQFPFLAFFFNQKIKSITKMHVTFLYAVVSMFLRNYRGIRCNLPPPPPKKKPFLWSR